MVTGVDPLVHGLIGDTFFDRQEGKVVGRPFPDAVIAGPKIWERLRAAWPESKSLAWFTPSLPGAAVDLAAWVDPRAGVVTQPPELASRLAERFGPYPAARFLPGGQPLPMNSIAWILQTAAAMIAEARPELALVRIPLLGQVARRFGPDGRETCRAVIELENVLKPFLAALPRNCVVLAATESMATPVIAPFCPNLVLRDLGLLELVPAAGGGIDIDLEASGAFAVTDHQLCHIYVNDPGAIGTVAAGFSGASSDAIDAVATGRRRLKLGLDHARCGDVVLVSCPDCWFAPNWWSRRDERPARLDTGSGLAAAGDFDPHLVQGSLGAPPPAPGYHGVLIASCTGLLPDGLPHNCRDLASLIALVLDLPPDPLP